jgi:hypothetical protein
MGGYAFLTISGRLSVNFECKERIEYQIYFSNREIEGRLPLLWEGAGIRTRGEQKETVSILRDRKSEFERTTICVVNASIDSKMDSTIVVDENDH